MKLEPCKICDGELKIKTENIRHDNGEISHASRLECQSCGAEFPYDGGKKPNGEWIRIEDRLPDVCERVIIYNNDDSLVEVGYLSVPDKAIWCSADSGESVSVTHWQPLPAPPTK